MAFERQSLKGPRGVIIQGPQEHEGESRYHWLEKVRVLDFSGKKPRMVNGGERMMVRVEKMNGTDKHYDLHSPIVSIQFFPEGVQVYLGESKTLKNPALRRALNPYSNAIARNPPKFLIADQHWREGRMYTVSYKTDSWGDFIIFDSPQQMLMLNLWAIFGMEGLRGISSNGSLYFGSDNEIIGQVPTVDGECLPFFSEAFVPNDFTVYNRTFEAFMIRSEERASKMFRIESRYAISARTFDFIAEGMYGDRGTTPKEVGMYEAREAFKDLFPEVG